MSNVPDATPALVDKMERKLAEEWKYLFGREQVAALCAAVREGRKQVARKHLVHCPAHPLIAMCICGEDDDQ